MSVIERTCYTIHLVLYENSFGIWINGLNTQENFRISFLYEKEGNTKYYVSG